jgi:hypothetical protein
MSALRNSDLQMTFLSTGDEYRGRILHLPTGTRVDGRGYHLGELQEQLLAELADLVTRAMADGHWPVGERAIGPATSIALAIRRGSPFSSDARAAPSSPDDTSV